MNGVRPHMKTALVLLVALSWASPGQASELKDQRNLFEAGIFAGAFFPSKDHEWYDLGLGARAQKPLQTAAVELGGRLGYLPLPYLGAEIEGGVMPTKTETDLSATLYHFRGHLIGQYPTRLAPFVVVGGGLIGVASDSAALGNDVDAIFHWGLGVKYYASDWLQVRLDGRHLVGPEKKNGSGATNHFEVLAGVAFVFGWKKDEPKDSDGDGITDDKDQCPSIAGPAPDGCPPKDTDGDGVLDDADSCPTVAGPPPEGCPPRDTDGDGIIDDKDQCPKEAGPAPTGCPAPKDTDGDGITDDKDRCPNDPETKNGYKDDDGCPDEIPQEVKKFTGAIKGITFDTNKATIRKTSFPVLDEAVSVLKEYPDLKLIIRGHTDNRGKREKNLTLSQQRADAVRDYMVGKGIDASRLKTEGLGPDEPVADNKTEAGRSQNRRIEFKLDTAQ